MIQKRSIKEELHTDIMKIMTAERNKDSYQNFLNAVSGLQTCNCKVEFAWASGEAV